MGMLKEELTILLDLGMSIRAVAESTNKSFTTVRYWMKKYGLKSVWSVKKGWTDEDLVAAVSKGESIADVLRSLGLKPAGGNYSTVKRAVLRLGLSTKHFLGSSKCKGRTSGRGLPLSEYLVKDGPYIQSVRLKKRLLQEDCIEEVCAICGLGPVWRERRLVLRLDHISGDSRDNRRPNLRLVCPNCDSQLPTFCGRNIRKK